MQTFVKADLGFSQHTHKALLMVNILLTTIFSKITHMVTLPITLRNDEAQKALESIIHTAHDAFVRNHNGIRLTYRVGSEGLYKLKHITLPTRGEAAEFLKDQNIINEVVYLGDEIRMYRNSYVTIPTKSIHFSLVPKLVPVEWDEINLNRDEVHIIACRLEWSITKRNFKNAA